MAPPPVSGGGFSRPPTALLATGGIVPDAEAAPLALGALIELDSRFWLVLAVVLVLGGLALWIFLQLRDLGRAHAMGRLANRIRMRGVDALLDLDHDPELQGLAGGLGEALSDLGRGLQSQGVSEETSPALSAWAALPVASFVIGPARRVQTANEAACRLFGRSATKLVGLELPALLREHPEAETRTRIERALDPTGERRVRLVEALRPNGDGVPVVLLGRPVTDESGDARAESCVMVEVKGLATETVNESSGSKEVGSEGAIDAVGRLAGSIAHDFNDILTAILGHSSLLLARLDTEEPDRYDVEEIARAAENARRLTRQLLAFSRAETPWPRVLDVDRVINEIRGKLREVLGPDVELDVALDPDAGWVRMPRSDLEEVLLLLARAARDAMDGDGRFVLVTERVARVPSDAEGDGEETAEPRGWVRIGATHGGGQSSLLRRGDAGLRSGRGSLKSVHALVGRHRGRLALHACEPGEGAIDVYLPRAAPELTAQTNARPEGDHKTTILVVEDDTQVRKLLVSVLEREGHQVLAAAAGDDALSLVRGKDSVIDLIVSDVNLPGMAGPELCRELLELRPEARVLFISGYVESDAFLLDARGRVGLLQKPFRPPELLEHVRRTLGTSVQKSGLVLLVDDDPADRAEVEGQLVALGYCVRAVPGAEDALSALDRELFDLLVTDMVLPGRAGIQLCAEVRRHFPDLPVVAISGRAGSQANLMAAERLGAAATLRKPFSRDELGLALDRVLAESMVTP